MDENLLEFLRKLRTLKNNGDLDDDASLADQTVRWRNRLEYGVLEKCLKHWDEEMRLTALAVLVESKKSTLCFARKELDYIIMFLRYNLGERMEYVPLIKKALKRTKESLAVLKRNVAKEEKLKECETEVDTMQELYEKLRREAAQLAQESLVLIEDYEEFFQSFRRICIEGLRPGSTNSRKRWSLLMLQLGQEFLEPEFKELPWTIEQADKLFECLLLDTYETNKETIYRIMKGIDPSSLRLNDSERVREIIEVALELGNCIRPIDSITASYMMKISLRSPVINSVLENYTNRKDLPIESVEDATLRLIILVVERLKEPLKLAQENIVAAAGKHSLYGYLFCIRNLLSICDLGKVVNQNQEAWERTIAEIIEISFGLNNAVSQIVNNSSPEGHLPMDLESGTERSVVSAEIDTAIVTPQMVLVCSWRTVKEVSLLFGYLTSKSPITGEKTQAGLMNDKQLIEIGEHLVTLLFETKHRGAFEQAHVGFGQLCSRLWRLSQENLKKLPVIWLHHLLLAISGLSPGNAKLCATRRSAGVPFMVQALVSSDPFVQSNPTSAVFHSVMKILLGFTDLEEGKETALTTKSLMYENTIFTDLLETEMKNDESTESSKKNNETLTEIKTHALNILRALFKHAQLGDLSKTYAADGLGAAIRSYDGKTWAERNAATLLFSALITRIFGVQRTKDHVNLTLHNKMTGRIFFERYPSLLAFMLTELRAFVESSDTLIKPSVQSILLLLSRLYPSFNSDEADSKWKIEEFINLVSACAKSKVYKTRELAARALVPLLTGKTVQIFVVELFEKISPGQAEGSSFNAQHGYMLQILEITKSPQFTIDELPRGSIEAFIARTRWIIENLESSNDRSACFPLASAYVNSLCELVVENDSEIEGLEKLFDRLLGHLIAPELLKQRPGREIYELSVAKFFVGAMEKKFFEDKHGEESLHEKSLRAWASVLSHDNVQVQIAAWPGVSRVIDKTWNRKLLDTAIIIGVNNMRRKIIDPDLQDSVYDFFYDVLMKSDDSIGPLDLDPLSLNSICHFVVTSFVYNSETNHFRESPSFMRLLGKAYGKSPQSYKDEYITMDDKRIIYKTFLDNTWMGAADTGCRIAISSVLHDLFIESTNSKVDQCLYLDWWTSLLNLLVDDNAVVRMNASRVVCKIDPSTELECICGILNEFFDKFVSSMREEPAVIFAALFAWSTSLSCDADYEMDESDVFNKCYNYEIFEPLTISDLCFKKLENLLVNYCIDDELPMRVRHWLTERLFDSMPVKKFTNFRELIVEYGKTIPSIDFKLDDVIDPTHNDKLLRAMSYKKFASIVS